jgi:hypothetical protein
VGIFRNDRRPAPAPSRPPAPYVPPPVPQVPYYAPPPPPAPVGRWGVGPAHVVWTAVQFIEQPGLAKDRPVLIVGREPGMFLVLTLSTQQKHQAHRDWFPLGPGPWDRQGRPSWVRLHPFYRMRETDVRRPGGVVDRARFDALRAVLARDYGWTFPNG